MSALCCSARAATLTVGAGQAYSSLSAAVAAANAGDTIDAQAGTYTNQAATINKALTIEGVGGNAVFTQSTGTELANLKGFLVINADATISNLSFRNVAISDSNGGNAAGICYQAGNLVVLNSSFIGNQNGILATPGMAGTGGVTVSGSLFSFNGQSSEALGGFEHAIYANQIDTLTVTGSVFEGTQSGHNIKSRAATRVVIGNTPDDGVSSQQQRQCGRQHKLQQLYRRADHRQGSLHTVQQHGRWRGGPLALSRRQSVNLPLPR